MEIFVPSLVVLLVGVAIAFFVLPTFAPVVLVTGSGIVLLAALYVHYKQFGVMEYERSTWMYTLRKYASYIMLAAAFAVAYGFYAMNMGFGPEGMATPPMPALELPVASGGGFRSVGNTVVSRLNELFRKGRITL